MERKNSLVVILVWLSTVNGITIPFFGTFGGSKQTGSTTVPPFNDHKDGRIINADHGVPQPSASMPGGVYGHSPWISGTRDQFIRDQLVMMHPDSPLNREAWKSSGYTSSDNELTRYNGLGMGYEGYGEQPGLGMVPFARIPQQPGRKPMRKPKQEQAPVKGLPVPEDESSQQSSETGQSDTVSSPQSSQQVSNGGFYEIPAPPVVFLRDLGGSAEGVSGEGDEGVMHDPIFYSTPNFFIPVAAPIFPYAPRAIHSTLPPEAMIQLLKNPEQEMTTLTRPQIKLPFPLSHDCSANSGSKPLQFVVLPIVEPVAPLKPIIPKPTFLSSQYGQFPYIPPFNLFNKKPATSNADGSPGSGQSSGQFVPILNRPAPPLPFVFVQSLPLELINHNMEMDVLNSVPSQGSESKINEVAPVAAPSPSPSPPSIQQHSLSTSSSSVQPVETSPMLPHPLPLIVIEKVKTPGQPPSSPVTPGATVVEISKQSHPKNGGSSGSPPLSTISVVKPITAPGNEPPTPEQQKEIQKAIEKLVPVAAAVLENVEKQEKSSKEGKEANLETVAPPTSSTTPLPVTKPTESVKSASLRPPLRPDTTKQNEETPKSTATGKGSQTPVEGIVGASSQTLPEVEIIEA